MSDSRLQGRRASHSFSPLERRSEPPCPTYSKHASVVLTVAIASVLLNSAQPTNAAAVEDFYKGRTVSIIIGYSVGGGYDTYARMLARYLGGHVSGGARGVA